MHDKATLLQRRPGHSSVVLSKSLLESWLAKHLLARIMANHSSVFAPRVVLFFKEKHNTFGEEAEPTKSAEAEQASASSPPNLAQGTFFRGSRFQ